MFVLWPKSKAVTAIIAKLNATPPGKEDNAVLVTAVML